MSILVGRKAPDFTAAAVLSNGEIVDNFNYRETVKGKYSIVFFYPLDFTFVCPSELIALDKRIGQLKERNVEVIAVSVDSHFTHNAWRNTPKEQGGIGAVQYTMVADINHSICKSYGIEHPTAEVALRAAFLVDKNGDVKSQIVNDLPLGRNIDELIRLVDALTFHEENGEVCPAGWNRGDAGMTATPEGVAKYLESNSEKL